MSPSWLGKLYRAVWSRITMRITVDRRARILCCLAVGVVSGVIGQGMARAAAGGFYVGVSAELERLGVLYEKIVDNTAPSNISRNPGSVFQANASAVSAAYGIGFLGGYRLRLGPSGIYVSVEGEMADHGGTLLGALPGVGTSEGRNQLGEIWPEDWTFSKERSSGLTARLGTGIPILGFGSGTSVYALAGLRRLKAAFRTEYAGCLDPEPCEAASELTSGMDSFDETFTGWVTGGGLEKRIGSVALRGELRFADTGSAGRIIPFDDVGVNVPLSLDTSGASLRVDLLWYF